MVGNTGLQFFPLFSGVQELYIYFFNYYNLIVTMESGDLNFKCHGHTRYISCMLR